MKTTLDGKGQRHSTTRLLIATSRGVFKVKKSTKSVSSFHVGPHRITIRRKCRANMSPDSSSSSLDQPLSSRNRSILPPIQASSISARVLGIGSDSRAWGIHRVSTIRGQSLEVDLVLNERRWMLDRRRRSHRLARMSTADIIWADVNLVQIRYLEEDLKWWDLPEIVKLILTS